MAAMDAWWGARRLEWASIQELDLISSMTYQRHLDARQPGWRDRLPRAPRAAPSPTGYRSQRPFSCLGARNGRKMARAEDVVGCRVKLSLNSVVGVGWGETAWKSGMAAVGWGGKAVWQ